MDWFIIDLVIFGIINDYDVVVVVLDGFGGVKEWFQWGFMGKETRKQKEWRLEITKNMGDFEIKLAMIGHLKNYDFYWVNRSLH